MKSIELTNEQYKHLVKLAHLGEWILNAQHVEPKFIPERECLNHLYSHCEKFGLKEWLRQFGDEWEIDVNIERDLFEHIYNFTTKEFWSELSHKLADRDAYEQAAHFLNIKEFEVEDLIEKNTSWYEKEFKSRGILDLRVMRGEDN